MSLDDRVSMSLDEIIRLNKTVSGNTVTRRGRGGRGNGRGRAGTRRQDMRTIKRANSYRQNQNFRLQGTNRRQVYLKMRRQYVTPTGRRSANVFRPRWYGNSTNLVSSRRPLYAGNIQSRLGRQQYQKKVRRATQLLNLRRSMQQRPAFRFMNPMPYTNRLISTPVDRQLPWAQSGIGVGTFRSDQTRHVQRLQQKKTKFRPSQGSSGSGSAYALDSDLTVSIANDFWPTRNRPQLVSHNTPSSTLSGRAFAIPQRLRRGRGRGSSNSLVRYLNRQNMAHPDAVTGSANGRVSPNGSIVSSVSSRNGTSARRRANRPRRSLSVVRERSPGSISIHSSLNPQLQREIAAIQGKTFVQVAEVRPLGQQAPVLMKPTTFATGTSLHERFSIA